MRTQVNKNYNLDKRLSFLHRLMIKTLEREGKLEQFSRNEITSEYMDKVRYLLVVEFGRDIPDDEWENLVMEVKMYLIY